MTTITADLADEILELSWGKPGETAEDFTYTATIAGDRRRWMQGITIVVSDPDGAFWGLQYDRGLTENQDSEYPWRGYSGERIDVKLTRLYPHTKTIVEYRTKPATPITISPDMIRAITDVIPPDGTTIRAFDQYAADVARVVLVHAGIKTEENA